MIEIKNVSKTFGSQKILSDVNLRILRGQKVAILGQNGAGKSSLMRIILGEFQSDAGEVKIGGFNPLKNRKAALELVSFVPQTPPPLKFSLAELCEFVCKSSNVKFEDIAKFCELMQLNLSANFKKPFYKLSGGMKQKMLISIAFAKNTPVMMFDEPTANLDPSARERFLALVGEFGVDKTLIFISHRLSEIGDMLDRCVEMDLGCVVKDEILKDVK